MVNTPSPQYGPDMGARDHSRVYHNRGVCCDAQWPTLLPFLLRSSVTISGRKESDPRSPTWSADAHFLVFTALVSSTS